MKQCSLTNTHIELKQQLSTKCSWVKRLSSKISQGAHKLVQTLTSHEYKKKKHLNSK